MFCFAQLCSASSFVRLLFLDQIPSQLFGEINMWIYVVGCSVFIFDTYEKLKMEDRTMRRGK